MSDMKNVYNTVNESGPTFSHTLHFANTIYPWTQQVWTSHVRLYVDFFFNGKSYSMTQNTDGWICGLGTTPVTEDQL